MAEIPVSQMTGLRLLSNQRKMRLPISNPAMQQTSNSSVLTLRSRNSSKVCARTILLIKEPYSHRSEEHTSELQSLMRISYAVFCLKKKKQNTQHTYTYTKYITPK